MVGGELQRLGRRKFNRIVIEFEFRQVGHFAQRQWEPPNVILFHGQEFQTGHLTDVLRNAIDVILADIQNLELWQSQNLDKSVPLHEPQATIARTTAGNSSSLFHLRLR